MQLRSLGLATDVALIATRGTVADRGDYLVLATPDDPGYYYGNLLVLARAPRPGEIGHWLDVFHREHAHPEIRHVTLEWDGDDDAAETELVAAGFTIERALVLTAPSVAPAAAPPGIELRALVPEELARATELAYANDGDDDDPHRRFMQRRGAWKRALVARRLAEFWGAFADGALVGSLGVVPVSTALGRFGRFQDVNVEAPFRRRGIAAALIAAAAAHPPPNGFAIVAEEGSDAARVYERAGFQLHERRVSACRYPANARDAR